MGTIKVLEDLVNAIENYPHEYLTLKIVEVDPPGNTINENDDVLFRIQVTNSGPLQVNQLSLLVEGLNDTEVKSNGPQADWGDSFIISGIWFGDVPAHQPNDPIVTGEDKFHFRPTRDSLVVQDLVRVSVYEWEADSFSHITNSHSRADIAATATYSATVSGS